MLDAAPRGRIVPNSGNSGISFLLRLRGSEAEFAEAWTCADPFLELTEPLEAPRPRRLFLR